jgi:hypothetical protein
MPELQHSRRAATLIEVRDDRHDLWRLLIAQNGAAC